MPLRDVAKQSCSRFFSKRQWLSQKGYAIFDSIFPVHRSKVYLCASFIGKRIGSDCCFINLNKHFFFLAVPNDPPGYFNPVLSFSAQWLYFPSACSLLVYVQSCSHYSLLQCQALAFLQLSLEENKWKSFGRTGLSFEKENPTRIWKEMLLWIWVC